jgi:hypothetical protein
VSNALGIAAVTSLLEYYLNIVYNNPTSPLGGVTISALAPDLVQASLGGNGGGQLQVNLFLHQVSHNAAWRNVDYPSVGPDGSTRIAVPPLALDLHYLLTAYASEDSQAEALLGYAVLLLHANPVITRDQVRSALGDLPNSNPLAGVLGTSGLADQIELIKITPATMNREELAWLWTALKADYRPTYPFQVSVVLIQPSLASTFALPVLSRNIGVLAGPPAQLWTVVAPSGQAAPAPGDPVTVTGTSLFGASQVALTNRRLGIHYPPFAPSSVTNGAVTFTVPDDPANLPAGVYDLSLQFTNGGGTVLRSTNRLPLAIAPTILSLPAPTAEDNPLGTLIILNCAPEVLPSQSVSLSLGNLAAPAEGFEAATDVLSFQFPTLSGSYLARLRVDGVESPVGVDWAATPPTFTGPFVTV